MHKLSFIILLIVLTFAGMAQSPHGTDFKTECVACHTSDNWKVKQANIKFDHSQTKFKLTGQHQVVDCRSCHTTLKFQEAKTECISCHTDMHQNNLGPDCARCHNTNSWVIEKTTTLHQLSRFPLLGKHLIVDCASCHKSASNLQFKPVGIQCVDCHRSDYLATTAPNHQTSKFSTDCIECHGVKATGWNATNFAHDFFPLTEGHNISCVECHKTGSFQKISNECVSCHQTDFNNTTNPKHSISGFSTSCTECHTTKPGWSPAQFKQHDANYFPIYSGTHKGEWDNCAACHTTKNYSEFSCVTCHEHNQTKTNEDHKGISSYRYSGVSCYSCHSQGSKVGGFDHNTTNFPLTGGHVTVDCASCHTNGFAGTSMECNSCHQKNFNNAQMPSHTKSGISADCKSCHTAVAWKPSSFKHGNTGFNLTGAHAAIVQCSACHLGNTTSAKPECISCHQAQYNGAKGHVASKFPTNCLMCHSSNNWLNANFDHSKTNFPLTGSHTIVECASCHTTTYAGTSMECKSCHQANFSNVQAPSHTQAGISADCKSCHTAVAWKPSSFKHGTTGFDLSGAHAAIVQCSACHLGNTTSAKPECISCHQAQYNGAKGHVASKFPTDCRLCHNSNNWLGATFDHSKTNFPLTGSHTTVECASCHKATYAGTSMECKSCHQINFNNAQVPSHTQAGISVDCQSCHTAVAWKPSSFKHGTTGFDLSGAHAAIVQCSACHLGNTTSAKPECISCHQAQYNGAKGHVASKFPTDCRICHNSNNWLGATFNHSQTNFPLNGAHTTVDCTSCHTSGYSGTSMECSSCHQTDYNQATNPNHKTLGLSIACNTCHTTSPGWQPASFPNHSTYFAFTGAHTKIANDCAACHKGVYPNTPKTCFGCHASDYNGTTNPSHLAAQFPIDCTSCHSINAWVPSTFSHDTQYFPIYSGKHQGKWTRCSECHTSQTNFKLFNCIICHEHSNRISVDDHHKEVKNYTYTGTSCFDCHPRGTKQ